MCVVGGLAWVAAYLVFAYEGLRQKTYCIPMVAICLNIAWELIYAFVHLPERPLTLWIERAWLLVDVVLLYTLLRWGRREQTVPFMRRHFHAVVIATLGFSIAATYTFADYYRDPLGFEAAFLSGVVMSALFPGLLWSRPSLRGISLWGSVLRGVGSALLVVGFWPRWSVLSPGHDGYAFMAVIGLATVTLDAFYVWLVLDARRQRHRALQPTKSTVELGLAA